MSYFEIREKVDKFTNTTTIMMNRPFEGLPCTSLSLSSSKSSGKTDSILIRYYHWDTDGLFGRGYSGTEGKNMIIRINDNENISLPFGRETCRVEKEFNKDRQEFYNKYHINNSVEINKMILEKICNATSIEFSLAGVEYTNTHSSAELQGFINYCRIFYNGLYNEDKYQVDVDSVSAEELSFSKPWSSTSIVLGLLTPLAIVIIIALLTR